MSETYFLIIMTVWNFIVFCIYGYDKLSAIKGYERISEFTLLFLAFAFGGLGALLGMVVCHHKTAKLKFKLLIPIASIWYRLWLWLDWCIKEILDVTVRFWI